MKKIDAFAPVHPGEVLLEEYLKPLGISQNKLALGMRVSPQRINDIINGKRSVTAETAIRLAKAIGTTPEFWLSLQNEYDLQITESAIGSQIENEVTPTVRIPLYPFAYGAAIACIPVCLVYLYQLLISIVKLVKR